jgi:hypothetical protein
MDSVDKSKITAWVDVMRTGTFSPQGKAAYTVTTELLDNCIALFSNGERRIPLVFGHPKTNAPAYGWVSSLRRVGDVLQAQFSQVHDDAKTLVENAYYKNVSVSLNQTGGIAHIGLLGAVQPAIPGLKEVQFSDDDAVILEFAARSSQEAEMAFALEELAEYKERDRQREKQEVEGRINALCNNGQLMPYERERVLEFALAVQDEGGTIQFSGTTEEVSIVEAFLDLLDKREPSMLLARYSGGRDGSPITAIWTGDGRPPAELISFNSGKVGAGESQEQTQNPAYLI